MKFYDEIMAGCGVLDEVRPGWVDEIDLDRLNLASILDCVLAQLYGGFFSAKEKLGMSWDVAEDNGFALDFSYERQDYETLTTEWREVIQSRRDHAAA